MRKIIRLTEGDLVKLIKRVINESDPKDDEMELHKGNKDVQKVVKTLFNFGWINPNEILINDNNFELSNINDTDFNYFYDGHQIIFNVDNVGGVIEVELTARDFGNEDYSHLSDDDEDDFDFSDEDDNENRAEVINYIIDNWGDALSDKGIEIFVDGDLV